MPPTTSTQKAVSAEEHKQHGKVQIVTLPLVIFTRIRYSC